MTNKWEEKDCTKCKHLEKDCRDEPCVSCGILKKGFEAVLNAGEGSAKCHSGEFRGQFPGGYDSRK